MESGDITKDYTDRPTTFPSLKFQRIDAQRIFFVNGVKNIIKL